MKGSKGFTLVEMVVVIGIFSLISLLALAMNQQALDLQKRTSDEQKAVSELRYAMETIAQNLRIGTIQYEQYSNTPSNGCAMAQSQQSTLSLVDEDGDQIVYELKPAPSATTSPSTTDCPNGTVAGYGCILKTYLGPAVPSASDPAVATPTKGQITASTLRVKDFKVYILPLCNPYSAQCDPTQRRQPIVTMVAGVDVPEKGGGFITRYVQTTVSSRVYQKLDYVCPAQ